MMRLKLLFFVSAGFAAFSQTAAAQCVDTTTNPLEPEVTCDGADIDGLENDSNNLSVTVNEGASVSFGDDDAVRLDGDDVTLTNNGEIAAFGDGDEGVQSNGENFTLINNGFISAADNGVQASDEDGATITNAGMIDAGDEGIEARNDAFIENTVSGVVSAQEDGVQFGAGTLINNGSIIGGLSADGDGVDIDSGLIQNGASGQILSFGVGAAGIDVDPLDEDDNPVTDLLTIENQGLISGEIGILVDPGEAGAPNNSVQNIIHTGGEILGTSGVAISLAGGDDLVQVGGGAQIFGDVNFDEGEDTLGILSALGIIDSAIFDGGDGVDTVSFDEISVGLEDVMVAAIGGDIFRVSFDGNGEVGEFFITNFELFDIADQIVTLADLLDAAVVPLPAGLPLLLTGLAGVGLMRRKRSV